MFILNDEGFILKKTFLFPSHGRRWVVARDIIDRPKKRGKQRYQFTERIVTE